MLIKTWFLKFIYRDNALSLKKIFRHSIDKLSTFVMFTMTFNWFIIQ